jgi:hypothetical protein
LSRSAAANRATWEAGSANFTAAATVRNGARLIVAPILGLRRGEV